MESSPLELYETAYRLHYTENRPADAIAYYQRLIKEFPDSNECGYAVIQLQKIKAQEVASSLKSTKTYGVVRSYLLPLVFISLFLTFSSIILSVCSYSSLIKKIGLEQRRLSVALDALAKISLGEYDEALKPLSELKKLYTDNIIPWELCAYAYRKLHKFDDARKEYETFFRLHPEKKPAESEIKKMQLKEKSIEEKPSLQPKSQETVTRPSPPPPPASASTMEKRKSGGSRNKMPSPPPPPSPRKSQKGLLLVDPDSISYF